MRKIAAYLGFLALLGGVLATGFPASASSARFYQDGSRTTRVYGPLLAVGSSPEESAERFRVEFASALGANPGDLRLASRRPDGAFAQPVLYQPATGDYKFTLVTYDQHREGIPVFRADLRVLVRNAADYPVVLASSGLRNLGEFAPGRVPVAFDPATWTSAGMETYTTPEPVIWAGIGDMEVEPVLAVTFVGANGAPGDADYGKWRYVADAATGEILYQEDMIIFKQVVGNISGMATEGPKADYCAAEVSTPMAWATAILEGQEPVYADANGNFALSVKGSGSVSIQSPMNGQYFVVTDHAGPEDLLTEVVVPPGPAVFLHNEANDSEYVRAQVNGYVQANVVRDFTLAHNPEYPIVATETAFPVNVNLLTCMGNAFYDYESINFCASGSVYPNMAYAPVVHHEYGHHLVQCAGSGQMAYGEGMSDSVGMLIADDPILGYGYSGDCETGLRTADNTFQYPCVGGIHYCGQLLSGCIWSLRNELVVTEPGAYLDIVSDLTINSILLHTGYEITPEITIDFLILDDDDGHLGNGSPHATEICAAFGAHAMDCPVFCDTQADCDDGLYCTGMEYCDGGVCRAGGFPCEDWVGCTIDECDEATQVCTNTRDHASCDDGNPCTNDFCDSVLDCTSVPDDTNSCDDGGFCNGLDHCVAGACLPVGVDPCPNQDCDETDQCIPPVCMQPIESYISHFTGHNCTGIESYYTPYGGPDYECRPADSEGAVCGTGLRIETNRSWLYQGVCWTQWPDGNKLSNFARVYREGIAPDGDLVSHFTGPDCTGEELFWTEFGGQCGPADSADAVCGWEPLTKTVLSWRASGGDCVNVEAPGWELPGHVKVYRGCGVEGTEECGNADCNGTETCATCPQDCGECCGNGVCEDEFGETCSSCPADCGSCPRPPKTEPPAGKPDA